MYITAIRKNQPIWPTGLDKALSDSEVHGGLNTAQAKSQEHSCLCLPVSRSSKPVPLCYSDGRNVQDTDDGETDEPQLWGAGEGVIEPGDKAPHHQQSNP